MQDWNIQVEINCYSIPCQAEEYMLQGITYFTWWGGDKYLLKHLTFIETGDAALMKYLNFTIRNFNEQIHSDECRWKKF